MQDSRSESGSDYVFPTALQAFLHDDDGFLVLCYVQEIGSTE